MFGIPSKLFYVRIYSRISFQQLVKKYLKILKNYCKVYDNFTIARETLKEKVFWKICFDALKKGMNSPQQELEELQAKAWKQRYPNGFKSDK